MIHLYGLIVGIAIVVGWSVAEKIEPKVNKVVPWVLGLGFVGARLYHVIDLWEFYSQNLGLIVAVWNGGMSIWGGLGGGGVGLLIASSRAKSRDPSTTARLAARQVGMTSILGAIVTGLPLAQAIGRIGNGVNGEFVNKVWILPWWAAEAILDLVLFGIIWYMPRADDNPPLHEMVRVLVYLMGYGLIRLVLRPLGH